MRGLVFLHANQLHKTLLTQKKSKIPIGIIFVALSKKVHLATEKYVSMMKIVIDSVTAELNCPRFQAPHTKCYTRIYLCCYSLTQF